MANWKTIMENYESNDCESLGEYAAELIYLLIEYFQGYYSKQQACECAIMCAFYFVDVDHFLDGGEEDVLRHALDDTGYNYNFPLFQKTFKERNLKYKVEDLMRRAPRNIKEVFARLGCAICSGKGYISEEERKVILSWV